MVVIVGFWCCCILDLSSIMLLLCSGSCFELSCQVRKPSVCYWFTCIDFLLQVPVSCSCLVLTSSSSDFQVQVHNFKFKFTISSSQFCTKIQLGFCFVYPVPYILFHIFLFWSNPSLVLFLLLFLAPVLVSGSSWASPVGPDCYQGALDLILISHNIS